MVNVEDPGLKERYFIEAKKNLQLRGKDFGEQDLSLPVTCLTEILTLFPKFAMFLYLSGILGSRVIRKV